MATPIFQIRSTQVDAWVAMSGSDSVQLKSSSAIPDVAVTPDGNPGTFGGVVLSVAHTSGVKALGYNGHLNWPSSGQISVLLRVVPRFAGPPGFVEYLLGTISPDGAIRDGIEIYINADGTLGVYITGPYGTAVYSYVSSVPLTWSLGVPTDIMFSWDGTTGTNSFMTSQNGVLVDQTTPGAFYPTPDPDLVSGITLGAVSGGSLCNLDFNEVVIFDSVQPVVYPLRTGFYSSTEFDGGLSTNPGVSNVASGVTYIINGVQFTGQNPGIGNNPAVEQTI